MMKLRAGPKIMIDRLDSSKYVDAETLKDSHDTCKSPSQSSNYPLQKKKSNITINDESDSDEEDSFLTNQNDTSIDLHERLL